MSRLKKAYDSSLDMSNHVIPSTPLYPQDYFKARDPELLKEHKEKHDKNEYIDFITLTKPTMTANENRSRKIAQFYDGFLEGDLMIELYINPSDSEIDEVKKQDLYGDVRGVIYSDGTKIIWPAYGSGHYDLNRKIEKDVDIYQFRYLWQKSSNEWIMDVDRGLTWDETINYIRKYKDFLSKIGNINGRYYLMAKDHSGIWQFSETDDATKVAKLKIAQFYDGIKYYDDYYEAYINPSSSEIDEVKKADPQRSVRGVIHSDGTKIIWPAEMGHYIINQHLGEKNIDIQQFRFSWENDKGEWIIDVPFITTDEAIKYIKDNKSFLSQIGDINALFFIMPKDFNSKEYYVNKDVASKSRLRKIAELIDGFMDGNTQYEVYKNPTDKEISYVKKEGSDRGVRGVIYDDGTIFIWSSDILHDEINRKILNKIDIQYCFRFAGYENYNWTIDAHDKYTADQTIELIKKHKTTLAKFGNIDKIFDIFYAQGKPNYYEFSLKEDNSPKKDKEKEKEEFERKKQQEEMERNNPNFQVNYDDLMFV